MARAEPSQDAEAQARAGLATFKSSGLHVLEAYISTSSSRRDSGQPSTSGREHSDAPRAARHGHAPASRVWTGHIPADNVGFRLLRKAGWSVGTGLGAGEQGRREPIQPELPKGTRGLGFDSRAAQQHQHQLESQGRKRAASEDPGGGPPHPQAGEAKRRGGGSGSGGAGIGTTGRMRVLVEEELARESLSDKVARHRQLMSVEQEQARGRAIDRYLRSAFNDPFDHLHSDNSNPLARRHQLTSSNPLLDPIGD